MSFTPLERFAATPELERQLLEMQRRLSEELRRLERVKRPYYRPTAVQRATYQARFDELVLVDSSAAAVLVLLPQPTTEGAMVAVLRVNSAGSACTVQALRGNIGAAATATVSSGDVNEFYVANGQWWQEV